MNIKTFNPLIQTSYSCLYAFLCPAQKKMIISHTKNLSKAIQSLLNDYSIGLLVPSELVQSIYDGTLEVISLETSDDLLYKQIRQSYWIDYYTQLGYTFFREDHVPRFKTSYEIIHVEGEQFKYKVHLFLQNQKKKHLVGVFNDIKEMNGFRNKYYKNGVDCLVYASTEETKEYFENRNT